MERNVIFIVGDKFKNFCKNKNVMSISEFEKWIDSSINCFSGFSYVLGQGISHKRTQALFEKIGKNKLEHVSIITQLQETKPDEKINVHKTHADNVLIQKPIALSQSHFQSRLLLNEQSELMLDHIKGLHIQGMVLIEAARQMILSVSEHYLCDQIDTLYCVLHQVNVDFKKFTFPLGVDIDYHTKKLERKESSIYSQAQIDFYQAAALVCTVNITFSLFEEEILSQKEIKLAERVIKNTGQLLSMPVMKEKVI